MSEQTKAQRLADTLERMVLSTKWDKEAAAELRRLDRHEQATRVWSEKTDWVQETAKPKELGMHRADVLKKRIDDLTMLNAELMEALEDFSSYVRDEQCSTDGPVTYSNTQIHKLVFKARAVLAKAKEQT